MIMQNAHSLKLTKVENAQQHMNMYLNYINWLKGNRGHCLAGSAKGMDFQLSKTYTDLQLSTTGTKINFQD
ncbi:hypothetical protein Desgi_4348 [Desulfoscipio gibsoniae DSM 7213]|uniref:Uncharacterized protein n=1 Tax=Desulfoscipio gibsoniae DSM 7213 TaxID=767817 RepID=R4KVF4_9FIRM|nr:hypothetical protein Desgi_4348 [Desulfoscipio gibsoniae DSM 7213]